MCHLKNIIHIKISNTDNSGVMARERGAGCWVEVGKGGKNEGHL